MNHWTTPAGMKYLGPHQDSAPLEIPLGAGRSSCLSQAPTLRGSEVLTARRLLAALAGLGG